MCVCERMAATKRMNEQVKIQRPTSEDGEDGEDGETPRVRSRSVHVRFFALQAPHQHRNTREKQNIPQTIQHQPHTTLRTTSFIMLGAQVLPANIMEEWWAWYLANTTPFFQVLFSRSFACSSCTCCHSLALALAHPLART